jgi:hypothetical protein
MEIEPDPLLEGHLRLSNAAARIPAVRCYGPARRLQHSTSPDNSLHSQLKQDSLNSHRSQAGRHRNDLLSF